MQLKKLASLAMAGVLCAGILAGCGSSSSSTLTSDSGAPSSQAEDLGNVNPVGEYPIVKEPITFKIMGRKDPGAPDWGELEVFKRLSETTNINFEFEIFEAGTWNEQKNIALVGGELLLLLGDLRLGLLDLLLGALQLVVDGDEVVARLLRGGVQRVELLGRAVELLLELGRGGGERGYGAQARDQREAQTENGNGGEAAFEVRHRYIS